MDRFAPQRAAVTAAILDAPGVTSAAARAAAHAGTGDGAIGAYVDTVTRHAYRTTDALVAALRAAGQDDAAIFELTVAAAVGQAGRQLASALAALAAATAEDAR